MSYGLLIYKNSYNLGDEIQSIAAARFLPRIDYYVDRDTFKVFDKQYEEVTSFPRKIKVIFNGWWDGQYTNFPVPEHIDPIFISFHVNEENHDNDSLYDVLKAKKNFVSIVDQCKDNVNIGCRDFHSMKKFINRNKSAYFTGCLTLTLPPRIVSKRIDTLVIDAHILFPKILENIIPGEILDDSLKMSQALNELADNVKKTELAHRQLDAIASSKLVITSRLHSFMPCIAFGIPCVFIHENALTDVRFSGSKENETIFEYLGFHHVYHKVQSEKITLPTRLNIHEEKIKNLKKIMLQELSNAL